MAMPPSTASTVKLKVRMLLWQYVAQLEGSMQRTEWAQLFTRLGGEKGFLYIKIELGGCKD
jgi:hypothetical protein